MDPSKSSLKMFRHIWVNTNGMEKKKVSIDLLRMMEEIGAGNMSGRDIPDSERKGKER